MSDVSKKMLEIENRAAGRVIPAWRFWLAYVMVPGSWIANGLVEKFDPPFWVEIVTLAVPAAIFMALLSVYKKKAIR